MSRNMSPQDSMMGLGINKEGTSYLPDVQVTGTVLPLIS